MDKIAAARLSVASNTLLVVLKLAIGIAINSVSVIAEAIHSGLDLLAALIAYLSVREAGKPADERHPFGHGKIENLSGTIEGLLILVAAGWIIFEAVGRLLDGGRVESTGAGLAVMGLSAAANLAISTYLFRVARATHSVALEADAMHLRTDVYTSLSVFAGLFLIALTGRQVFDPLLAVIVGLLIALASFDLIKASFLPLLDISLPADERAAIMRVLEKFEGRYLNVHSLRTRRSGAERHIDLHMVLPKAMPISEAHRLCDEVEAALASAIPHAQVLIHVEPCDHEGGPCATECHACRSATYGCPPADEN